MKFLVTAHLPDNYQPSPEDAELGPQIHAFNAKMEAAGALFFACGLMPASLSKVARPQPDGNVLVTDGQGEVIARFNGMVYRKNEQLEAGGR